MISYLLVQNRRVHGLASQPVCHIEGTLIFCSEQISQGPLDLTSRLKRGEKHSLINSNLIQHAVRVKQQKLLVLAAIVKVNLKVLL